MYRSKSKFSFATIFNILLFTVIGVILLLSFVKISYQSKAKGREILEQSINKAVVTCYASEGRYPDTLEYIEKNYHVKVDRSKYDVEYNIFASNIYPDITVTEKETENEK
ncbi:MAG: hypothetical protein Q4E28_03565 [Clostridia bacterium]|nr:hypothetical protein [Clostridia bacterium]